MATELSSTASVMPTAAETAALLKAAGVVEAPHGCSQPLGPVGLLAAMADPPPPPMSFWGWLGRDPVGVRVGFEVVRRADDECLDVFRLRVQHSLGGPGIVGHFTYRPNTK